MYLSLRTNCSVIQYYFVNVYGAEKSINRKSLVMYSKLCVEFYDLEMHPNHDKALEFYMFYAQQAKGPILEPMCGSGRFLIPMLQAGLEIEGFDASPYMLDALRKKYSQITDKQAPVTLQVVQEFTSNKLYKLIFIPYGSWGLIIDKAEAQKGLNVLCRSLAPGGKLLIEIETVASVPQPCGVRRRATHTRLDGSLLGLSFITSYDEQKQIFQSFSRYESIVNNQVKEQEEELFEQYLYRIDEFDNMLNKAGLSTIKKYPAFDPAQAVNNDTPIIIYECSKDC